jgi:hypothetical protein
VMNFDMISLLAWQAPGDPRPAPITHASYPGSLNRK